MAGFRCSSVVEHLLRMCEALGKKEKGVQVTKTFSKGQYVLTEREASEFPC
jgi:hypothetical protein